MLLGRNCRIRYHPLRKVLIPCLRSNVRIDAALTHNMESWATAGHYVVLLWGPKAVHGSYKSNFEKTDLVLFLDLFDVKP